MRTLKAIVTLPFVMLAAACESATTSVSGPDVPTVAARKDRGDEMSASSRRSGALHLIKDCPPSTYTGLAGEYCTITSSNIRQIKVGSRIIYLQALDVTTGTLDSDVILDPPGKGNSIALGHCTVKFAPVGGGCTFTGGTGKFKRFRADLAPSHLAGTNWALDGTYSFVGKSDDDDDDGDDDDED
jgi:hypothetical protein